MSGSQNTCEAEYGKACFCNPSYGEMDSRDRRPLQAGGPANLIYRVVNKRPCIKQSGRRRLTPRVVYPLGPQVCDSMSTVTNTHARAQPPAILKRDIKQDIMGFF